MPVWNTITIVASICVSWVQNMPKTALGEITALLQTLTHIGLHFKFGIPVSTAYWIEYNKWRLCWQNLTVKTKLLGQGFDLRSRRGRPVKLSLGVIGNCVAPFASNGQPKRSGQSQSCICLTNAPGTRCYTIQNWEVCLPRPYDVWSDSTIVDND